MWTTSDEKVDKWILLVRQFSPRCRGWTFQMEFPVSETCLNCEARGRPGRREACMGHFAAEPGESLILGLKDRVACSRRTRASEVGREKKKKKREKRKEENKLAVNSLKQNIM